MDDDFRHTQKFISLLYYLQFWAFVVGSDGPKIDICETIFCALIHDHNNMKYGKILSLTAVTVIAKLRIISTMIDIIIV